MLNRKKKKYNKLKNIIENSNLFDKFYYLKHYHEARIADLSPLDHYCKIGIKEDLKPNDQFDPVWYKNYYKDVKEDGMYPFVHFIIYGQTENRLMSEIEKNEYDVLKASGTFDANIYRQLNSDVHCLDNGFDCMLHYLRYGKKEGRQIKPQVTKNIMVTSHKKKKLDHDLCVEMVDKIIKKTHLMDKEEQLDIFKTLLASYQKDNKRLLEENNRLIDKLIGLQQNEFSYKVKDSQHQNFYNNSKNSLSILKNYRGDPKNIQKIINNFSFLPINFLYRFDELKYLDINQDVKKTINEKKLENALSHFLISGMSEVLQGKRILCRNTQAYKSNKGDVSLLDNEELKNFMEYIDASFEQSYDPTKEKINVFPEELGDDNLLSYLRIESQNLLNYLNDDSLGKKKLPKVSMVILTRNGHHYLKTLFKGIHENTRDYPHYEVIVVDNASEDETISFLEQNPYKFNLKIIKNTKNETFSKANNQAAAIASGELLLLLNNDVEPMRGWLPALVKKYLENPKKIGSVGAKLIYPYKEGFEKSLTIQHAGIAVRYEGAFYRPYNLGSGDDAGKHMLCHERIAVTAACVLISKKRYDEVGGLDERYNYGYEDVDLGLKLLKKGYVNIYTPESQLYHYEFGTQKVSSSKELSERRRENIKVFKEKWHDFLKKRYWDEKLFLNEVRFAEASLKIAIAVTDRGDNVPEGDYFTALELGNSLGKLGYKVAYLSRKKDEWYEIDESVDVLISLLDAYDLKKLPRLGKQLITIAWARNWFERWCENDSFDQYDLVFASSQVACDYIENNSHQNAYLLPIATNIERFEEEARHDKNYECDYCFTGSHWGEDREVVKLLEPKEIKGKKFHVYGKNWESHEKLKEYNKGFVNYHEMPTIYKNTKIVLDDANRVTKPFGSVNSRVFDALGHGKLVLTNGKIGAKELFNDKLPSFETTDELHRLLEFYLTNDEAREKLILELNDEIKQKHTYDIRATTLRDYLHKCISSVSLSIKIPVPRWEVAYEWGDYHLALALKKSFERHGIRARLEILSEWNQDSSLKFENVIVLRGLSKYITKPTQYNIMWNISHPDKIDIEEYSTYDLVLIASDVWAKEVAKKIKVPVKVMHQCSDTDLFTLPDKKEQKLFHSDVLFVGNSRKVYRKILKDFLPTDHDLHIYGSLWEGIVPDKYIKGKYIPNHDLSKYYGSANVLLNDHWDDMREKGFLSNRIYDALASGAQVISDKVDMDDKKLLQYVSMYENKKELKNMVDNICNIDMSRRQRQANEARDHVIKYYSVESRAQEIISIIKKGQ